MHDSYDFDCSCDPPYEFVQIARNGAQAPPKAYRHKILIHTVHDGGAIPRRYRFRSDGSPLVDPDELAERYTRERDWGANLVAGKMARALAIGGYARCRVARVLVDFNRFPGSTTPPGPSSYLERMAINTPFAEALSHDEKLCLLEDYYDRISDLIEEQVLIRKLITITVHTYDERNPSLTRRPEISLISQSLNYQREARMPFGVFDPMFPDRLMESTCSRVLRDRISLNLERSGFRVIHNHPYPAPEGSFEVRSQVWYFFFFLRQRFEAAYPETKSDPAYQRVWTMLLNTNLRLDEAETLRSYLHRYRKVQRSKAKAFRESQRAYVKVAEFLRDSSVMRDYRRSRNRPSSLGIEIRKDLVCSFDPETGAPLARKKDEEKVATMIGEVVAGAIKIFFETDREFR